MLSPTWNRSSGQKYSTSDISKIYLLFFLHHYCLYQGSHSFFLRLLKSFFCLIMLPSALAHSDSSSILQWFFSPKYKFHHVTLYFSPPDSSVCKESACNAGDPGSTPGSGRSPGEGKGYPLQYSGLENSINCVSMGSQRAGHNWATFTFTFMSPSIEKPLMTSIAEG